MSVRDLRGFVEVLEAAGELAHRHAAPVGEEHDGLHLPAGERLRRHEHGLVSPASKVNQQTSHFRSSRCVGGRKRVLHDEGQSHPLSRKALDSCQPEAEINVGEVFAAKVGE